MFVEWNLNATVAQSVGLEREVEGSQLIDKTMGGGVLDKFRALPRYPWGMYLKQGIYPKMLPRAGDLFRVYCAFSQIQSPPFYFESYLVVKK